MNICFIDPPSEAYDNDRFFDINNLILNRDNSLVPYYNLKNELKNLGFTVTTFDRYQNFEPQSVVGALYISFGRKRKFDLLKGLKLRLFAFFLLEPPLVDKKMYDSLPSLTKIFQNVFIHNNLGDCYSLKNVDVSKLKKLYWPQPQSFVTEKCWVNTNRFKKIVLINGNHKPKSFPKRELYSQRIKWAIGLNEFISVDLYGRGWSNVLSRSSFWLIYIKNYFKIKQIYKGPCSSKINTMSQYDFALCFENLSMQGYITEKIFDCFYAGTIPIYWGGNDIEKWIPGNCFIDAQKFSRPEELALYLNKISEEEISCFKNNAKNFLESENGKKYANIIISLTQLL